MGPPVIQNLRNVHDLLRLRVLGAAQHKIIILCAVVRRIQSSRRIKQFPLYHDEVAKIVHAAQKIRVVIRFKMRLKILLSFSVDLVLVCIEQSRLRFFLQNFHTLIQRIRCKQIIMIAKGDEISGCFRKSCVCIFCNAKLFLIPHDFQFLCLFRVSMLKFIQKSVKRRVLPATI